LFQLFSPITFFIISIHSCRLKNFILPFLSTRKNPVQILTYSSFNCLKNTYSSAKVLTKEFREVISSRQKRHSALSKMLKVVSDDKQKRQFYHQPFLQIQNAMLKFFFEIRVEGPQTVAFLYAKHKQPLGAILPLKDYRRFLLLGNLSPD